MGESGFIENGPYLERVCEIRGPRASGRLRRVPRKSRDFAGDLRNPHDSRAVCLRHLLGFLGICRDSSKTGHVWPGDGEICDHRARGRPRRIFGKSRHSPGNLESFPISPRTVGLRHLLGILGVMRKRGQLGAGDIRPLPRGRLRWIFGKSRDYQATLRNFTIVPYDGFAPFT